MDIVPVFPPYLYALRYSEDEPNEFHKALINLTSDEYLYGFFERFKDEVSDFWIDILGDVEEELEEYVAEVNDTALDIRTELIRICRNNRNGGNESFLKLFEPHSRRDYRILPDGGGRSKKYGIGFLPVKCFGLSKPSLVRIYAIEVSMDCYIIVYGGIKVNYDTNDCPAIDEKGNKITLEQAVRKTVMDASNFLNGVHVFDRDSLLDYMKDVSDETR